MDIGGIIQGVAAVGDSITNAVGTAKAHEIAKQNLQFQKDAFAYQKELNNEYLKRQDNKLQYLVEDAKKSGINPLAAIGQAGGYSPLQSGQAPQEDNSWTQMLANTGTSTAKAVNDAINADNQTKLIASQTANYLEDTELKNITAKTIKHDLEWANKRNLNVNGNMPDWQRDLWMTFKPFAIDLLDYYNKDVKDLGRKIDKAINFVTNTEPIYDWFEKKKNGVIEFKENFMKQFKKELSKHDIYVPDSAFAQFMSFIIDSKIKTQNVVDKIKGK